MWVRVWKGSEERGKTCWSKEMARTLLLPPNAAETREAREVVVVAPSPDTRVRVAEGMLRGSCVAREQR